MSCSSRGGERRGGGGGGRRKRQTGRDDFLVLDRHSGTTVHQVFNFLLEDGEF